jgi:hypothetical protein
VIIANKSDSILKANEIAHKIMQLIKEEVLKYQCEDDPAENIYLVIHTISIVTLTICSILEAFSKTHGIDKMDKTTIYNWIESATREYLKNQKDAE